MKICGIIIILVEKNWQFVPVLLISPAITIINEMQMLFVTMGQTKNVFNRFDQKWCSLACIEGWTSVMLNAKILSAA